jgi:hypothetical protein
VQPRRGNAGGARQLGEQALQVGLGGRDGLGAVKDLLVLLLFWGGEDDGGGLKVVIVMSYGEERGKATVHD